MLNAQDSTIVRESGSPKSKHYFNVSYYGNNLWNPGLKFGAGILLHQKGKDVMKHTKKKGDVLKHKEHQFFLTGDIGFYWEPKHFTALFSYFGVSYRKTNTKGFNYNFGLSPLSVYRSFLVQTYEVDDAGNVSEVSFPGRFYYAPTLIAGIGKKKEGKFFTGWFLNANFMTLVKYNANMLPLLHIEFGFRFN